MADLILGQPSNLTTVSAGGGGNVRVTYAPWELDWGWFDAIAIGHWLANTTTATSDDIVAKGGSEHLGYWFEISTAFPDANWNTGNRITPQRQAAINQYATFALAVAAMAVHDTFLVWYRTTANFRAWNETIFFTGAAVGSVWGMLSRCQIVNKSMINYTGNLLAQNIQVRVVNLRRTGSATSAGLGSHVLYNPGVAQAGAGIWVDRMVCTGGGGGSAVNIRATATANTCLITNSLAFGTDLGFAVTTNAQTILNCTAIGCFNSGFNLNVNVAGGNLVAAECGTADFVTAGLCQNCADTDGSLPVHATNLRNQDMRTQLRFFFDLASPGLKKFPRDYRIQEDSVLVGAGLLQALVPRDCDGRLRPNPPSIGAWEPYSACYSPGAELIRGALRQQAEVA